MFFAVSSPGSIVGIIQGFVGEDNGNMIFTKYSNIKSSFGIARY